MRRISFAILVVCFGVSCSNKYSAYLPLYAFPHSKSSPDYSDINYWAAHPWKKDPSDSMPSGLNDKSRDSLVDVFFIHPTTYINKKKSWNADINDGYMNAKTDYTTVLYQASAFNQYARVFAPRYRQAHFSAFFTGDSAAAAAFDTAYADVKKAFEYYLQHHNNGKPMIIAGHSQGAMLGKRLLKEFFDGKRLQTKLIAAYIIGWPVPLNYFASIPICATPDQTGCFCSWRTFLKGYIPSYIKKEQPVSYVTNPLSWTTVTTYIDSKQNTGSVLRDFNKIIPFTTGAQVNPDRGILWVNKPRFPGSIFYLTRNYHIADINLFYMNVRQNIEQRIKTYFK